MIRLRPLVLIACTVSLTLNAQEPKPAADSHGKKPAEESKDQPKDKPSEAPPKATASKTTEHSITLNGQKIDYTATAGTLPLKDAEGKVTAEIFHIAYVKKETDPAKAAKRPLTFSFNGGPGSSSVWMHMGLLGPKRVKLQDNGFALPPPYTYIDNESSLLDETDLVFIDPVSTGYSRAAKPDARMEAITSRPLLLAGVARMTKHAGQSILHLTPLHAGRTMLMKLIDNIRAAISHIKTVAEQLPDVDPWKSFIDYVTAKIIDASINSPSKVVPNFNG